MKAETRIILSMKFDRYRNRGILKYVEMNHARNGHADRKCLYSDETGRKNMFCCSHLTENVSCHVIKIIILHIYNFIVVSTWKKKQ